MRKWIGVCLLLCLLTACGQKEPETTAWEPDQMVRAILDTQDTAGQAENILRFEDASFAAYLSDYYGLEPEGVTDGSITYAGGVSVLEIAVLRLTDGENTEEAVRALEAYIDDRAGAFAGYAPEQYAILEASGTASRGQYAALLICPDLEAAREAFFGCFTASPPEPVAAGPQLPPEETDQPEPAPDHPDPEDPAPAPDPSPEDPEEPQTSAEPEPGPVEPAEPAEPVQPDAPTDPEPADQQPDSEPDPAPEPEPWSYSEQRILDAWNSGSREGLWEQDRAILDALEGIPALTDGTLTDYQRELALHDWMIDWAEYDPGALSSGPRGEPMPDNDNPYGFLTGRKGICLGYTSTFQLLMKLSGIECVTVHGTAHSGTAEHAWNLVKLDGSWYAVDSTWDDPVASFPVPEATAHLYFNVTDEFLRAHDHQWDAAAVPAADGTVWTWS